VDDAEPIKSDELHTIHYIPTGHTAKNFRENLTILSDAAPSIFFMK